jgi:hypothetical protein
MPEEFGFSFPSSIRRDTVLHLGQLDFLAGRENVVLLGPPGTGKTHLAIALGIRACLAAHRVAFRTATEWVALLADAQRQGRLDTELDRLQRLPLLIVDEVVYIPFDPQAANLKFMLVSRRYERASLAVGSAAENPLGSLGGADRCPMQRLRAQEPTWSGQTGGRGSSRGGSALPRRSVLLGFGRGARPGMLSLTLRPSLVVSSRGLGLERNAFSLSHLGSAPPPRLHASSSPTGTSAFIASDRA